MDDPVTVQCPWCGEAFTTFFDASAGSQTYIEDCQVCCQPITMRFLISRSGRTSCQSERAY